MPKPPEGYEAKITHIITGGHPGWKGYYGEQKHLGYAGTSRARNYDGAGAAKDRTSITACNHCMQWIWDAHKRQTGEECPWDFTPACA